LRLRPLVISPEYLGGQALRLRPLKNLRTQVFCPVFLAGNQAQKNTGKPLACPCGGIY
jgi:hypothetical protein